MTGQPCPRCHRATTDGLLCHTCVSAYTHARKDLTRFTPELRAAWMRLDNVARATTHRPQLEPTPAATIAPAVAVPVMLRTKDAQVALVANPLPVNLDAGALYREATLWLGVLNGVAPDAATLRRNDDAPRLVDETRRLARAVEEAIDRRDPELYLGVCDAPDMVHVDTTEAGEVVTFTTDRTCGVDLYAHPGDRIVTCQACGYEYPISERRAEMLAEVRNLLERPKVIAEALTSLDLPVTAATLDVWIMRDKRLHERGRERRDGLPLILADPVYDDHGKPLYPVGAVIDRVEAARARARSDQRN